MLVTVVAVCALVLAYAALVAAWLALRTLGRLRRQGLGRGSARGRADGAAQAALAEQMSARLEQIEAEINSTRRSAAARSRTDGRETGAAIEALRSDVAASLRRVALVRYDAFGDHGGRLSFSLALLDDAGDGVALTSIAGRTETRLYAKGVRGGEGDRDLSPEEVQAVRAAMRQTPGAHARAS